MNRELKRYKPSIYYNPLNVDWFVDIFKYLDITSICLLLQTNKEFIGIINESSRENENREIIKLSTLPSNSILFENICYFQICYCGGINDVPAKVNETHLIDFCLDLGSCTELCTEIIDVSSFGKIHTLYIEECCTGISNVSALKNVNTLVLTYCTGITNVSALGNVHNLDLSHCTGITDVSALGKVHTLDLSHCTGISDVSALRNVHKLNLSYCRGITYISALGNVNTLNVLDCGITFDNIRLLRETYPSIEIDW